MLFDVVFYADSEYHGYFARKSIFGSQNREIRVQLFNRLPPISKELISQPWKIFSEKSITPEESSSSYLELLFQHQSEISYLR
jgi:hypothetical protein